MPIRSDCSGLVVGSNSAGPRWLALPRRRRFRDGKASLRELDRLDNDFVRSGAGLPCTQLARQCIRWGLGPSEFFAGIPGTVGGALAMNAGRPRRRNLGTRCESVKSIDRTGAIHERTPAEYTVGYRSVSGPPNEWFLEATFQFEPGVTPSMETMQQMLERRKTTQPLDCRAVVPYSAIHPEDMRHD